MAGVTSLLLGKYQLFFCHDCMNRADQGSFFSILPRMHENAQGFDRGLARKMEEAFQDRPEEGTSTVSATYPRRY